MNRKKVKKMKNNKELHVIGYALTGPSGFPMKTGNPSSGHRTRKIYSSHKIAESAYKKSSYHTAGIQLDVIPVYAERIF